MSDEHSEVAGAAFGLLGCLCYIVFSILSFIVPLYFGIKILQWLGWI